MPRALMLALAEMQPTAPACMPRKQMDLGAGKDGEARERRRSSA